MHPSRRLFALAVAFTCALCAQLSACGGSTGGEDTGAVSGTPSTPTIPAAPAAGPLQEFEGTWLPRPGSATCNADFPYNTAYFHRFREVVVTSAGEQLHAAVRVDVFQDAGCTTRLGLLEERFTMDTVPATVSNRSNVIKGAPLFTDAVSDADGGLGMNLTTLPDGSALGLPGQKLLMDRDGNRLYVTRSGSCPMLDCHGYPVAIQPDDYLVN